MIFTEEITHNTGGDTATPHRAERWIVAFLISLTTVAAMISVVAGYHMSPRKYQFLGTTFNTADFCNYLSWMRQTADGHLLIRNLFTTEKQPYLQFNLLFSFLGTISRITGLPLPIAWHGVRLLAIIGALWLVYRFYRTCIPQNSTARLVAFGFVCLSSGLGWMSWKLWAERTPLGSPTDVWQPEATTFLCLYTSTLFAVSLVFIVGALHAMLLGERTGRSRYAVIGGLCGLVLGNIHSYDALHISAAWGVYLIVWTCIRRGRGVTATWIRTLIAAAIMAPSVLFQYFLYRADPVFQGRANVPTLSASPAAYALGYGIVFALAFVAFTTLLLRAVKAPYRREDSEGIPADMPGDVRYRPFADAQTAVLISCWAVAGLLVIYLPLAFQRRMLMGEHIPLCLLAGGAASWGLRRFRTGPRIALAAILVMATMPTNILFLCRDIHLMRANQTEAGWTPYIPIELVQCGDWLRQNTPDNAAVVGFADDCSYIPGSADRAVWAGHWGETPEYKTKMLEFLIFANATTSDRVRRFFLGTTHAQYLIYPTDIERESFVSQSGARYVIADFAKTPPPYLSKVYQNAKFAIFHIDANQP